MGNDDIVKRLRNWDNGGVSTHYDGCIDTHWRCAILLAAAAIESRDAEIERLRAEVERLREGLSTSVAHTQFLLDTYGLWSEDGVYTIPDGTTYYRYRTKSGRILTSTDIEALSAEAEQGYDITELTTKRSVVSDDEGMLADRLAVALAAQGSASFDENTNLNIKKLALDAYKDARGIGNADAADVEGHP